MARYYKKFILFIIPLFIIFISYDVDALSFSSSELGYNLDGTWNAYDSSNLSKSFSTPASKSFTAFNYRLTLNSYFQQDDFYNITFNLYMDYNYTSEFSLKDAINEMSNRNIKCYFTSSGSVQTADACFQSYTFNISEVNVKQVKYNLSFVPKRNIYRILIQQEDETGSNLATSYGWTTSNLSYTVEEDKTAGLIGETNEKLDSVNDNLNDINDSLTDDNVNSDVGTGFFDDFNNEDFGLSEIITIPLNTINSLTSKTCQPLSIPIPKTNKNINLPCMRQVYEENIPSIFTIWQVVSFGIIAYFIAIDIFHLVKGFKDPESDKVEVLDL